VPRTLAAARQVHRDLLASPVRLLRAPTVLAGRIALHLDPRAARRSRPLKRWQGPPVRWVTGPGSASPVLVETAVAAQLLADLEGLVLASPGTPGSRVRLTLSVDQQGASLTAGGLDDASLDALARALGADARLPELLDYLARRTGEPAVQAVFGFRSNGTLHRRTLELRSLDGRRRWPSPPDAR
jgi:hypothetical protein